MTTAKRLREHRSNGFRGSIPPPESPSVLEEPPYLQVSIDVRAWVMVLELFRESTVLQGKVLCRCRLGACKLTSNGKTEMLCKYSFLSFFSLDSQI